MSHTLTNSKPYFSQAISSEFDNVFYESPITPYNGLSENLFLEKVFANLKSVMNENFHEYIFYIFSFNKKQDILPNSIYNETSKKKVLVYITDELGYVPYHLSSHYHAIFKVYLQSDKFDVQNIFNFPVGCHKDVLKLPIKNINDRTITIFFSGNLNYFRLPLYFYLLCGYVPPRIILRGIIFLLRRSSFLRRIFTSYKFDSKFEGSYIRFTSGFKQGLSGDEYQCQQVKGKCDII